MSNPTIVIVKSKLTSPEFRDQFLELSRKTEQWMHSRPGFIRYELIELDDGWIDTMLWDSPESASAGNADFSNCPLSAQFAEIVSQDYNGWMGRVVDLQSENLNT